LPQGGGRWWFSANEMIDFVSTVINIGLLAPTNIHGYRLDSGQSSIFLFYIE
jgi:hypothetical protein